MFNKVLAGVSLLAFFIAILAIDVFVADNSPETIYTSDVGEFIVNGSLSIWTVGLVALALDVLFSRK